MSCKERKREVMRMERGGCGKLKKYLVTARAMNERVPSLYWNEIIRLHPGRSSIRKDLRQSYARQL